MPDAQTVIVVFIALMPFWIVMAMIRHKLPKLYQNPFLPLLLGILMIVFYEHARFMFDALMCSDPECMSPELQAKFAE
jgi:hypothetical protein